MKNVTENNKLIADFMGYPKHKIDFVGKRLNFENSKHNTYHKDWNWLMEVVEKIESLGYKVHISTWENSQFCGIYLNGKKISGNETNTKIEAVYNACIEFIKWYNTQNK